MKTNNNYLAKLGVAVGLGIFFWGSSWGYYFDVRTSIGFALTLFSLLAI